MKYKIILGSGSSQKLGYLQEVLREIEQEADITTADCDSGISSQPLSSEETKRGALARARQAFNAGACDFSFGIEVGYELSEAGYEMLAWVSVCDGNSDFACASNSFLLPRYHQEILASGKDLGPLTARYHEGCSGPKFHLGEAIRCRDIIIKNALVHALLLFLNRADYRS